MTTIPVEHLARLLQALNQNFTDANYHLSRAWVAHEMMRDAIFHLTMAYDPIVRGEEKRREK